MTFARQGGWLARLSVILLGAMAAFGFAPFHLWGLMLLSLTGLFIRLWGVSHWERPAKAGFATGLLFGLGWFSASCFWIASAFIERGEEFLIMIPPLVGGLAVLLSLFWGAAGAITARLMKNGRIGSGIPAYIAAFTLAELARGHILSGFPWNMAAYAFEPGGAMSQSASLFGVYGLTMACYIFAACLGTAIASRKFMSGAVSAGLLTSGFAFGAIRLSNASVAIQPGINLRIVDVSFRQSEKMDPDTSFQIVNNFISASLAPGLDDVTHLIWPEGAVNGLAIENRPLLDAMGALLTENDDTPPVWLMNSLRLEITPDPRTGEPKQRYYNSSVAVTFDDNGIPAIAATNDKHKLVPFGEFIPGGEIVENLGARIVSMSLGSISPSPEKRLARFPGLPLLSPQICYEVIFPGLTPRTETGEKPEFILNQSNDAWFGATIGPPQHAAIARYRSIEEGLPLVRAAANGINGVFDAYGRRFDNIPSQANLETSAQLTSAGLSHIDSRLPKSLNKKQNIPVINLWLTLINLVLLLLSATLRRAV